MPDSAVPALLELDGVSKSFGRVVVADNLSLAIGPGDMVGDRRAERRGQEQPVRAERG